MRRFSIVLMLCCVSLALIACDNNEQNPLPTVKPQQNNANNVVDVVTPLKIYKPTDTIRLIKDTQDVPHIYANNDLDLFYGAGYQLASERMFELDVNRRKALGQMAEVFGRDKIGFDYQARALGFARHHKASLAAMAQKAPGDHNLVVAYVAGINAYVTEVLEGKQPMPARFEQFEYKPAYFNPEDVLAIGLRINFGYSSQLEYDLLNSMLHKLSPEIANVIPIYKPGDPTFTMMLDSPMALRGNAPWPNAPQLPVTPPKLNAQQQRALKQLSSAIATFRENRGYSEGSNAWIVNGEHTFNGRPIVANDSHSGLRDPNDLYLMHLNSKDGGGSFDVMGFGFIGIPGVQLGHNRDLAWAATTHFADMMDIFEVFLDKKTMKVRFGDKTHPVRKHIERIKVRGESEDVVFEVLDVEGKGVFIPGEILPIDGLKTLLTRKELFLAFPGYGPTDELSMFFDLDRAKTLDDFDAAIDLQKTGMQNWHGATKDGMRYRTSGQVPIRGKGDGKATPNRLLDASNEDHVWSGDFLPKEIYPKLDGAQRFHLSANNDPFGHTADNNPLNDEFYYASFYSAGYRAGRLNRMLAKQADEGKIDIDMTRALQLDVVSLLAQQLKPTLENAKKAVEESTEPGFDVYRDRQDIKSTIDALLTWNGSMDVDSRQALIHRVWLEFLGRQVLADDMGLLYDPIYDEQPIIILKILTHIYTQQLTTFFNADQDGADGSLAVVDALAQALALIDARGWKTWGDVHGALFTPHVSEPAMMMSDMSGDMTDMSTDMPMDMVGDMPVDMPSDATPDMVAGTDMTADMIADQSAEMSPDMSGDMPDMVGNASDMGINDMSDMAQDMRVEDMPKVPVVPVDPSEGLAPGQTFVATGGDGSSINVAQSRCWANGEFGSRCSSSGGAVFRTITSFEEDGTPKTIFNFAAGNGALLKDWAEGVYMDWYFRTADVEANTKQTIILKP